MLGLNKIKPAFFLRLGLGLMFVYSGLDLIRHPAAWDWAVRSLPSSVQVLISQIGVPRFLFGQGLVYAEAYNWFARMNRKTYELASILVANYN